MNDRGRLARRLVLAFLLVALVPLGLLAIFGPRIVRGQFQELSRRRVAGVLEAIRGDLRSRAAVAQAQVNNVASDREVLRLLALGRTNEGIPQLQLIDYIVERQRALGLEWLEVVNPEGVVLARGHDRGSFGMSVANQPLIAAGLTGQPLSAIVALEPPDSGLALFGVAPVLFEGRVLGVVRGGPVFDQTFVNRLRALTGSDFAVLDSSGTPLASTFPEMGPHGFARLLRTPVVRDTAATAALTLGGAPYRLGAIPLENVSDQLVGRLVVGVSEGDLARTLESLLRLAGAAALIGFFVAVGAALLFAYRISRPVRALALASGRVAQGDLRVRLPSGPNDEIGELMAAFNQMTHELAVARERLVRGERHAAWSQVARRLAHEIKNPLTPLLLSIEEVERARERGDPDFDSVLTRAIATVKAEVRTLRDLVREFSEFARSPAPRPEALNLHELLDRAADLYVPSSVEVRRHYAPNAASLVADPDLLARALGNLIKNACEAMDGQGVLSLETRRDEQDILVTIRDSGPGVRPEDRERIFTPYYTTKSEGTGLGLAIALRVAEDHGGVLEVESTDRGAVFVLRLPAAGQAVAPSTPASMSPPKPPQAAPETPAHNRSKTAPGADGHGPGGTQDPSDPAAEAHLG